MPPRTKKTTDDSDLNLDDLLGNDTASEKEEQDVPETPAEEKESTPEKDSEVAKPKEDSEAKALQDENEKLKAELEALKKAQAEKSEPEKEEKATEQSGDPILVHFVRDGFTFGGQVFYRGQEVEFDPESRAYDQQRDRFGDSWLDIRDDPAKQRKVYGDHYFSSGAWPYRAWGDDSQSLSEEEADAIRKAADKEKARGRKAPVIPENSKK